MSAENETISDIVAEMRNKTGDMYDCTITTDEEEFHSYADRIEAAWKREAKAIATENAVLPAVCITRSVGNAAAWKREQELLRSCARWINTHDIYSNMAKELLAECKEVLHDDGNFLMPKGEIV